MKKLLLVIVLQIWVIALLAQCFTYQNTTTVWDSTQRMVRILLKAATYQNVQTQILLRPGYTFEEMKCLPNGTFQTCETACLPVYGTITQTIEIPAVYTDSTYYEFTIREAGRVKKIPCK